MAETKHRMILSSIKAFLDEKADLYNHPSFIDTDPIQVPRYFTQKEDIEIAAFLTSVISWGNRASIIKNGFHLMRLMGYKPFEFITQGSPADFDSLKTFVHRTFNGDDCIYLVRSLRHAYLHHNGLEGLVSNAYENGGTVKSALSGLRTALFELPGERTRKHLANVDKGASAKRQNMFLRWMVRRDNRGVDFGIWPFLPASHLMLPLDVHSGNVARKLGLLHRNQNDWKAVEEITQTLSFLDPSDPVKYDFALFGLGVFEKF